MEEWNAGGSNKASWERWMDGVRIQIISRSHGGSRQLTQVPFQSEKEKGFCPGDNKVQVKYNQGVWGSFLDGVKNDAQTECTKIWTEPVSLKVTLGQSPISKADHISHYDSQYIMLLSMLHSLVGNPSNDCVSLASAATQTHARV